MIAAHFWKYILLAIGLVLIPLTAYAQEERLSGADEIMTRAATAGGKQDYNGAVGLLKAAIARYPTYPRLYTALLQWEEARGLSGVAAPYASDGVTDSMTGLKLMRAPEVAQDLFETMGLAVLSLPDSREIRQHAAMLAGEDFPVQLGPYGPFALPGAPLVFSYTLSDPRLPTAERGVQQALITTLPLPVSELYRTDPKYGKDAQYLADPKYGGWTFQHVIYAYNYDRTTQAWHLRFRVIWQQVPGQEEARAEFARTAAQLMLRIAGTVNAYTGLLPRFGDSTSLTADDKVKVVNIWLAENGDPGGEAYNENMYIYDIGAPRAPAEWVREFAHEYGHQTLPPVGGYVQPEWGANGHLAERMFLRWLTLNPDLSADAHPWVQAVDPSLLDQKRIFPLIKQFAIDGPQAPVLRGTDAAAMNAFIGMALYLEHTRGSGYLAGVLRDMKSPSFAAVNGFLASVESEERFIQNPELPNPTVTLHLNDLPDNIPYRVYLNAGTWQGEIRGTDLLAGQIKLAVDGKDAPLDILNKFKINDVQQGWHLLQVSPIGDGTAPDLSTIRLVRQ